MPVVLLTAAIRRRRMSNSKKRMLKAGGIVWLATHDGHVWKCDVVEIGESGFGEYQVMYLNPYDSSGNKQPRMVEPIRTASDLGPTEGAFWEMNDALEAITMKAYLEHQRALEATKKTRQNRRTISAQVRAWEKKEGSEK